MCGHFLLLTRRLILHSHTNNGNTVIVTLLIAEGTHPTLEALNSEYTADSVRHYLLPTRDRQNTAQVEI